MKLRFCRTQVTLAVALVPLVSCGKSVPTPGGSSKPTATAVTGDTELETQQNSSDKTSPSATGTSTGSSDPKTPTEPRGSGSQREPEPLIVLPRSKLEEKYQEGERFQHYTSHVVQGRAMSKTWFGINGQVNIFLDNASYLDIDVIEVDSDKVRCRIKVPRIEQQLVATTRRIEFDPDLTEFGKHAWTFAKEGLPEPVRWTGQLIDTIDPKAEGLLTRFCGKLWKRRLEKKDPYLRFARKVDEDYQGLTLECVYVKDGGVQGVHQLAGKKLNREPLDTLGRRLGSTAFLDYIIHDIIAEKLTKPGQRATIDATEALGMLGLPWDVTATGTVTLERKEDRKSAPGDEPRIVLAVVGGNVKLTAETENGPHVVLIQPKEGEVHVTKRGMVDLAFANWEVKTSWIPRRRSLLINVKELRNATFHSFVSRRTKPE